MPLFAQDIIHKLELGRGYRVLKFGVGIIAVVALAAFYNMAAFENFSTLEAMDAAQVARNVSEGKGFTTDLVRPLSLYLLGKQARPDVESRESRVEGGAGMIERCPDLSNGPGYPLLLAGVLKAMPFGYPEMNPAMPFRTYSPEVWIAGFNQLLLLGCAFVIFLIARRLFDEPVAWVSAGVFVGAELFWRHSVSGLPTLWLTFLVLVLGYLLVRVDGTFRSGNAGTARPASALVLAVCVGVVTAVAGLTRYSLLLLIVPVLGYLLTTGASATGPIGTAAGGAPISMGATTSRPTSSRLMALAAGLGFLALVVPWLVRNYSVSGTLFGTAPYVALSHTAQFPGDTLMRSLSPELSLATMNVIGRKVLLNLREIWLRELPALGGSWVTALFLAGLVVPFRNVISSRLRLFAVACLTILMVAQAVVRPTDAGAVVGGATTLPSDYLSIVAPLVFIFGVSLLFTLLDQFTALAVRYAILATFLVCACAPLLLTFAAPRPSPLAYPPYYPPSVRAKAAYIPEDGWIVSDMPWAIAWYGNRKAVWLPLKHGASEGASKNDFYSLHRLKSVRGLHLTHITMGKLDSAAVANWRRSEAADRDWEEFRAKLRSILDATGSSSNKGNSSVVDSLKDIYTLAEKHWVRGKGDDWESFVLGILVTREVPTGFPLRMAPEGILPAEILLTDNEHPATKTIKVSEQADRP